MYPKIVCDATCHKVNAFFVTTKTSFSPWLNERKTLLTQISVVEHDDFLFLEMTRYLSQDKYLLTCIEICFFTNAAHYRHFLISEVFLSE